MKLKSFISVAAILLFLFCSKNIFSQSEGNYAASNLSKNSITKDAKDYQSSYIIDSVLIVETNVLMNVNADSYIVIFSLSQFSDTISECYNLLNTRIENFTEQLLQIGIEEENIYIDFISQVPVFETEVTLKRYSKSFNEIPKGFELKENIHIKYFDYKQLNKIVAVAANNEIYDLSKVDYLVKDYNQIYDTMRTEAINYANKKIEKFKLLGVNINTEYITLNETYYSVSPIDRYASYKAFDNSSYIYAPKSKNTTVTVVNKKETSFYNKLPYDEYDIVINPEFLEPAVQFTYNLKIKYCLKSN